MNLSGKRKLKGNKKCIAFNISEEIYIETKRIISIKNKESSNSILGLAIDTWCKNEQGQFLNILKSSKYINFYLIMI